MATDDYLGRGGRLVGGPAPELVRAGYAAEIAAGPRLARALSRSDLAHAVALIEGGAIDAPDAGRLVEGLLELDAIDPVDFPWNAELGDAFNSREHELRKRIGPAASGWLSAGRPRREAFRVALRLVARDGARNLHDAVTDLAHALADQADRHAGDLAADYTYLQPAQPTTLGHLLLAYAYPALRDAERLREVVDWLDLSVAGAGGSAGSRWPLERERLADLLGCTGVVRHAKDAMWQSDGYVELGSAVAIATTGAAQLAQDLEIMASHEFAQVSLADQHSRASALMPQKRNPYALAVIRAAAGTACGDLAGLLVTLHTGSARTDHFHHLNSMIPRLLEDAGATMRLAAEVVAGLTFHAERTAAVARSGFTTAADVADVVAQRAGLDYRSAHKVVGRAVRDLVDAGRPPEDLTPGSLSAAAEEAIGRPVEVPPDALVDALDPERSVLARLQTGSSAPDEVAAMVADVRAEVAGGRRWSAELGARVRNAERRLMRTAAGMAGRA